MKTYIKLVLIMAYASFFLYSCKDDPVVIDRNNYDDGVDPGENIIIPGGTVDNTLNLEGGDVNISGGTKVTSDINVKDHNSEVIVSDSVTLHKINMDKGVVRLIGSPTINTDFNVNRGKVFIGTELSTLHDTVTVKNNLNLFDTLLVLGGVFVVEKDFNHNGFISISNNAKMLVLHNMNKHGDLYGKQNLEVVEKYNDGGEGLTSDAPWNP